MKFIRLPNGRKYPLLKRRAGAARQRDLHTVLSPPVNKGIPPRMRPSNNSHAPYVGIDSIVLAFDIEWTNPTTINPSDIQRLAHIEGIDYAIHRHRPAQWNQSPMWFYLEHGEAIFGISTRPERVVVQARSMACMRFGEDRIREMALALIRALDGKVVREALWEIDIRLDLLDQSIKPFIAARDAKRYVKLAHDNGDDWYNGRDNNTVSLGTPDRVHLNIYNKMKELSDNPEKRALTIERCWNGREPAQAIRIEYRIGKEVLRDHGCRNLDDFHMQRRRLIDYLVQKWFRFVERTSTTGNTNRVPVDPLWQTVQEGFQAWAGEATEPAPKIIPPSRADLIAAGRKIRGILEGAMARNRSWIQPGSGLVELAGRLLRMVDDGKSQERVRQKQAKLGITYKRITAAQREALRKQRAEIALHTV